MQAATQIAENTARTAEVLKTHKLFVQAEGNDIKKTSLDVVLPDGWVEVEDFQDFFRQWTGSKIDALTSKILKTPVGKAKDKSKAIERLAKAVEALPVKEATKPKTEAKPKTPRAKVASDSPHPRTDKNIYRMVSDPSKLDAKALEAFAPQARAVIKIMAEGGKDAYTGEELRDLLARRTDLLKTTQDPFRIFQYYKSEFQKSDLLRIE